MYDNNLSDIETISLVIKILNERFDELLDPIYKSNGFVMGEVKAYLDCYDMVSAWSDAINFGLDPKYLLMRVKK